MQIHKLRFDKTATHYTFRNWESKKNSESKIAQNQKKNSESKNFVLEINILSPLSRRTLLNNI
jgi:hypothetical protein